MKNNNSKTKLLIIVLLLVALVGASFYLIKMNNNNETISVTDIDDNSLTNNDDLKNIKEEESNKEELIDADGNREITITNSDGKTNTIIISKEEEGSGVSSEDDLIDSGKDEDVTPVIPDIEPDEPKTTFQEYNSLSSDEQYKFYKSFPSAEEFITWYNKAKAEYEKANPSIKIGEGDVVHFGEE